MGIGLHTGRVITMRIHPAPEDHGIVFVRTDIRPDAAIPARFENVVDTTLATTLGSEEGIVISTVEHLLSSFFGMGVDNAVVEVDGPEVPIMDGSAAPFVYLFQSVGIRDQEKPKQFLVIQRPFRLEEGDKRVSILPSKELKVTFSIDFDHPLIQNQILEFRFSSQAYMREICKARTFGFLRDVYDMQRSGYARGGSLENAVVLDDYRVLNSEGLRYKDEFVRHKVLDSLGDLFLLGRPMIGHLVAHKSGHTLNHKLIKELKAKGKGWKTVEFPSREEAMCSPFRLPALGGLDAASASP
jgi:UDP-3-O-[3-hydroxymyristoyl] N-acetylglucosamine deacetylase